MFISNRSLNAKAYFVTLFITSSGLTSPYTVTFLYRRRTKRPTIYISVRC